MGFVHMLIMGESKMHECEEFISQCCGAERHEYVDTICTQCSDHTGFECIECGVLDGIAAQRGEN